MSKMQFFNNGNKRTSLCFCNAILIINDIDFIKINSNKKFVDSLIKYYENDKYFDRFLTLVKRSSLINLNSKINADNLNTKIITLLNSKLLLKNLSQIELAKTVGVSKSFINQLLSAKKRPSIDLAKKIGKILNLD
jgi:predicted XRE-type DNA-binding protein